MDRVAVIAMEFRSVDVVQYPQHRSCQLPKWSAIIRSQSGMFSLFVLAFVCLFMSFCSDFSCSFLHCCYVTIILVGSFTLSLSCRTFRNDFDSNRTLNLFCRTCMLSSILCTHYLYDTNDTSQWKSFVKKSNRMIWSLRLLL